MGLFSRFNQKKDNQQTGPTVETWNLTVSGTVQGVGFRWSVLSLAQKMGFTGSVCNNRDQTVTITLQASLADVNRFCTELPKNISPYARISTIKKEKLTNVGKMSGFHVLY